MNIVKKLLAFSIVICGAAVSASEWSYSSNAVSDGNWTLGGIWNAEAGALTITGCSAGSGVLDLRDMSVNGVSVAELRLEGTVFRTNTAITEFYANRLCGVLKGTFNRATKLTTIDLAGSGLTEIGDVGGLGFAEGCSSLKTVRTDCPNLCIIGDYAFNGCPELEGAFSDIIRPCVTNIGRSAFYGCKKLTGGFALDKTDRLGAQAFQNASQLEYVRLGKGAATTFERKSQDGNFEGCAGLTNVVIEADSFTMAACTFYWCRALKHLELVVPEVIPFAEKKELNRTNLTFGYCDQMKEVVFAGPAPDSVGFDTLLTAFPATDGEKPCTIYASLNQPGWTEAASPLTDAERAIAPAGCFGVCREGSRKAWLVNRPSPLDPRENGFLIVQASPSGYGTPNVPYATYQDVEGGTAFSVDEWYEKDDKLYRVAGYTVEELNGENWSIVARGNAREWNYEPSEKMQRLTWNFEFVGGRLTIMKGVTVSPDPVFNNCYTNGTPMILTAHDFDDFPRAKFVCWRGSNLPAGIDLTSPVISFAFDDAYDIDTQYQGLEWAYDATGKTITDRNWTLGGTWNAETGALTITGCSAGSGVLDLRDMSVNGVTVAELRLEGTVFRTNTAITEFHANRLCGALKGTFNFATKLTTIDLAGSGLTEISAVSEWGFAEGCSSLKTVRTDCPNLCIIGDYAFDRCPELEGAFSDIIHPCVTNIGRSAFHECKKLTGGFALDKTDRLGAQAFQNASQLEYVRLGKGAATTFERKSQDGNFEGCAGLTNVVIEADSFTMAACTFYRCSALKHLELVVPEVIPFAEKKELNRTNLTFGYCDQMKEVVFAGPAPDSVGFDTLLTAFSATDGEKPCTIYASKRQSGWREVASPLTDAERAVAPARCFGVCREGSRKAWLVHRSSPFDPSGLIISVQ